MDEDQQKQAMDIIERYMNIMIEELNKIKEDFTFNGSADLVSILLMETAAAIHDGNTVSIDVSINELPNEDIITKGDGPPISLN